MTMPGIPYQGFQTIGEIVATNSVKFRAEETVSGAAIELLSNHLSGAPVVSENNELLGFISEIDVLKVADSNRDPSLTKVTEIMNPEPIFVDTTTSISDAHKLLAEYHILVLPIVHNGQVINSVTRHDLLRAFIGIGLGVED
ncbi:MAG: membrane protein [Nitrospirales bacterium]|nr:MAG: membrane protein [Nitrospirales bacterium]